MTEDPELLGAVHVFPMGDAHAHKLGGKDCPCQPRVKRLDDRHSLVLHNSFDGREFAEWWRECQGVMVLEQ